MKLLPLIIIYSIFILNKNMNNPAIILFILCFSKQAKRSINENLKLNTKKIFNNKSELKIK